MSIEQFLIFALLVAACIPVLDVVASWFYWRATHPDLHLPSLRHGVLMGAHASDGDTAQAATADADSRKG